ncbi:hypothetical protein EXQ31_11845 [Clostridium botulinum]|uniref:Uncharacterized protein n=1 Tax=Clostridium botulinum TaxID=1491 RepID=A0A1L7JNQ6_CLOBO|nr:hypothetical protein [Clostridium botulinum]AJE13445.1 hypothetical protein T259_4081 [Clostridium botulinum CDC_1436]APU87324.1 hypothetical protein NPD8_4128 [Clostridium botulinum]MBO0524970.1 hypothetical protein [Clostridium botulinum]MBO0528608.1 hypothetical protein [Clostridium botulinum]MBO0532627.1 hypothetical protein [Clostridium botulinum]
MKKIRITRKPSYWTTLKEQLDPLVEADEKRRKSLLNCIGHSEFWIFYRTDLDKLIYWEDTNTLCLTEKEAWIIHDAIMLLTNRDIKSKELDEFDDNIWEFYGNYVPWERPNWEKINL